jgi:mannose-1-phosphate guanylyltransferase
MKALILVGGFGTRLRPLTISVPKPMVDFCNKPVLEHQIEALAKVGVTEVILAINYQPQAMIDPIKTYEQKYKVKIVCSQETEPLGTAGPLKLAQDNNLLTEKDTFFVFNSDISCEFPLADLVKFHKESGAEGTIMLTKVDEPSKYGVVLTAPNGQVKDFIEKPKEFISNRINAGIYILNGTMLSRIEPKPTSIEREVFPQMAKDNKLFAMDLEGFWMDIGQPKDFITGTKLYLNSLATRKTGELTAPKAERILGNVLIDPTAKVHPNAVLGPDVVIGPGCEIEDGVRLQGTCVMKNTKIKAHSWISGSIIGWNCTIGKWVRIEGVSVLADDVQVKDEIYINGCSILPHKGISSNLPDKGTIVM